MGEEGFHAGAQTMKNVTLDTLRRDLTYEKILAAERKKKG